MGERKVRFSPLLLTFSLSKSGDNRENCRKQSLTPGNRVGRVHVVYPKLSECLSGELEVSGKNWSSLDED